MSELLAAPPLAHATTNTRIAVTRALLALAWAAALVVAIGDRVPATSSDLPVVAALLLATYPLVDVAASLAGPATRALRVNAALSATAAAVLATTAFGADAAATLVAFGVWASASGALQLAMAVQRRRALGGQTAMLISGGLSTLAGLSFISAAGQHDAHLAMLGGYMAIGAVLYLVSARTLSR